MIARGNVISSDIKDLLESLYYEPDKMGMICYLWDYNLLNTKAETSEDCEEDIAWIFKNYTTNDLQSMIVEYLQKGN